MPVGQRTPWEALLSAGPTPTRAILEGGHRPRPRRLQGWKTTRTCHRSPPDDAGGTTRTGPTRLRWLWAKAIGFGSLVLAGLHIAAVGLTAPWAGGPEGVTLTLFGAGLVASTVAAIGGCAACRGYPSAFWAVLWVGVIAAAAGLSAILYAV